MRPATEPPCRTPTSARTCSPRADTAISSTRRSRWRCASRSPVLGLRGDGARRPPRPRDGQREASDRARRGARTGRVRRCRSCSNGTPHDGHVHWGLVVSAPFLLGLATQLPFGLLAAAIAFALGAAAHASRRRQNRSPAARAPGRDSVSSPGSRAIFRARRCSRAATPAAVLRRSPSRVGRGRRRPPIEARRDGRSARAVVRAGRCSSRLPPCWWCSRWRRRQVRTRG